MSNYFEALERTEAYFTTDEFFALKFKRKNRGMVGEANFKKNEGDDRPFSNSGADVIIDGVKYEFKYLGNGSKPSVTEKKRLQGETLENFAHRVIYGEYGDVDKFALYFDDDYDITLNKCIITDHETMKQVIINENEKEGYKTRLTSKNRVIKTLQK